MAKRAFDIVVACVLFGLCLPLMALIALAIKTTSRGPIIFRQERVGYQGRTFVIWKFRTMFVGSARPLDVIEKKGDPRVTLAGRFLRPTHLDELPQLWNVLKGEMSLVGPRPHPVDIERREKEKIFGYEKRYLARPGMTGPGQLYPRSWFVQNREEVHRMEVEYIERSGILRDCAILFKTAMAVIEGRGA